ncbi:hypothetical protein D3C80_1394410 [compost metagenome]
MHDEAVFSIVKNKRVPAAQKIIQIGLAAVSVKNSRRSARSNVRGKVLGQLSRFQHFAGDIFIAAEPVSLAVD